MTTYKMGDKNSNEEGKEHITSTTDIIPTLFAELMCNQHPA
jgi:hypothetical protein